MSISNVIKKTKFENLDLITSNVDLSGLEVETATNEDRAFTLKKIFDENFGAAFGQEMKAHYGADQLMLKDINDYLNNHSSDSLPVDVIDCMEAGLVAMKIDEARTSNQIIDLTETWKKLDSYNL